MGSGSGPSAGAGVQAQVSESGRSSVTCRAVVHTTGDQCGAPARYEVHFLDGDHVPMCESCALAIRETAQSHGATLKVVKR
jgi:hypothetical protein